ncbi:putative RNA-binding protein EEED8.10 isoform X2 [Diadema setosum]|uniref:putative RNA-binding protein EEED8.10 isoform X2 n=1 Tax=Diadema setosum TaxID=31175 RepID=UPI003B3B81DE
MNSTMNGRGVVLAVVAAAVVVYWFWKHRKRVTVKQAGSLPVSACGDDAEATTSPDVMTQATLGRVSPSAADRSAPPEESYQEDALSGIDPCKVFVSNISFSVRTSELREFFQYFGRVTQVNLLRDGKRRRSRGMAFITFSCPKEASKAKRATHFELSLDGRVMKCSAMETRSRKIRGGVNRQLEDVDGSSQTGGSRSMTRKGGVSSTDGALGQDGAEKVASDEDNWGGDCKEEIPDDSLINNYLPDDVLAMIFGYLSVKEKIQIESVCRRWRRVVLDTWPSQRSLHFNNVFKGFTFSDGNIVALNDNILKSILKKGCCNLHHLDLSASPRFITSRSLNCIGNICRELRHLDLSGTKINNTNLKMLTNGCRKIEKIVLKRCHELGEKGIWWLFHNCENLSHVDLEENRRINGKCFHILNRHCKTVVLEGCSAITDKGLDCLTNKCGQSLKEINISGCVMVTDGGLRNLTERCPNLDVLSITGVHSRLTAAGLAFLGSLHDLHTLHLSNHRAVSDAVLATVATRCQRLRELKIDGCPFDAVTDTGMQSLAKCAQLESLNISYLGKVSDEGVKVLAMAGRLQKLVARCVPLTDKSLGYLAAHCPKMKEVDVCGCEGVTVCSIKAFLEARNEQDEGGRTPTLTLVVGGTSISSESLEELGSIDPSVTICLQDLAAPPGMHYPALHPRVWDVSSEEEEEDERREREERNALRLEEQMNPIQDPYPPFNFHANEERGEREYLQVPADSDEPWDGVVQEEQIGVKAEEQKGDELDVNGAVGEVQADDAQMWSAVPGQFAAADPDLAQFQDVEEDLLNDVAGEGWLMDEEDCEDFLDADDPALLNDLMFMS